MLLPKKVKFRKWQRGRVNKEKLAGRIATRGTEINYGAYGMKAQGHYRIRSNHIESVRRVLVRTIGKNGRVWIRIFPDLPYSKKPAEVRMGKGKGAPEGWCAPVKAGRMLFEMEGVSPELAREALRLAAHKLPCPTRFCEREGAHGGE